MLRALRGLSRAAAAQGVPPARGLSTSRSTVQDWIDDPDEGRALIFGKTWCGFSQMAIGVLELQEASPTVVQLDLLENGDALQRELHEITGMPTVPSVWIGGQFIGGYSELSRVPDADLQTMLEEAGALDGA
eukprot:g1056.t1